MQRQEISTLFVPMMGLERKNYSQRSAPVHRVIATSPTALGRCKQAVRIRRGTEGERRCSEHSSGCCARCRETSRGTGGVSAQASLYPHTRTRRACRYHPCRAFMNALLPSPCLLRRVEVYITKRRRKSETTPHRVNLYTGCGSTLLRLVPELYLVGAGPWGVARFSCQYGKAIVIR